MNVSLQDSDVSDSVTEVEADCTDRCCIQQSCHASSINQVVNKHVG